MNNTKKRLYKRIYNQQQSNNLTKMKYFLIFIFIGIFVSPILTFLHELGHATPTLVSGKKATIVLGNSDRKLNFKIRNLELNISLLPSYIGFCYWPEELSRKEKLISLISGPLVSLIISIFCFYFILKPDLPPETYSILIGLTTLSFIQFLTTAIPMHYPSFMSGYAGLPSDGFQIMELIKSK